MSEAVGGRISTRRKWAAIGVATLLLAGSFWLVLYAFDRWLGDLTIAEIEAGAEVPLTRAVVSLLTGGYAVMGAAFVALALISRRPHPWRGASVAWLLGGAMWLLLPFVAGEPYTPMVAGFAAGGLVALRAEPEHTVGRRAVAALVITVYVYLLLAHHAAARGDRRPAAPAARPGLGRCPGRAAGSEPRRRGAGGEAGAAPGQVNGPTAAGARRRLCLGRSEI